MNALTWVLVLAGVALNAGAQLLLKAATTATGPIALNWDGLATAAPRIAAQYAWWGGIACYAVSVLIWLLALSRAPVSIVYPMLSLGYVANALAASVLFQEALSPSKVLGIAVIIGGVYLLSRSGA
jgi:multidrug transporter EmrE-like cation transporter